MSDLMKETLAVEEWENLRELWLSGIITRNEYREAVGYEKLPPESGDVYILPPDDPRLEAVQKLRILHDNYPEVYAKIVRDAKAKGSHGK